MTYRASSSVRKVKSRIIQEAEHVTWDNIKMKLWEITPSVNFSVGSAEPLDSDIIALAHHEICFSELPCKLMIMSDLMFYFPH